MKFLPHEIQYFSRAKQLFDLGIAGGTTLDELGHQLTEGTSAAALGQGTEAWRVRQDAFRQWMAANRGIEQTLNNGHRAALYLLGGPDAGLMDERILAGGASGRELLRQRILHGLTAMAQGAGPSVLPLVVLRDPAVHRLIDNPQKQSPENLQRVAAGLATDRLLAELGTHAEMAVRSATLLPETDGAAYWAEWKAGSVHGPRSYAVEGRRVGLPRLFQAKSSLEAAVRSALAGADQHPGGHLVVYAVQKPEADYEFAPFARFPDHQVVFSRAQELGVKGHTVVRHLATAPRDGTAALEYSFVTLDQVAGPASRRWQEPLIVRRVRTDGGVWFGEASFTAPEWYLSSIGRYSPSWLFVAHVTDSQSGATMPFPLPTGLRQDGKPALTLWASHGDPGFACVLTPVGYKNIGGAPVGRRGRRLAAVLGLRGPTPQFTLSCDAATDGEGRASVARAAADEQSGVVVGATSLMSVKPTTAHDPRVRMTVHADKKGNPGHLTVFRSRHAVTAGEKTAALPLAGQGSRYRRMYGTPEYKQAAQEHERAIGQALDASDQVRAYAEDFTDALNASQMYHVDLPTSPYSVADLMDAVFEAVEQEHSDWSHTIAETDAEAEELMSLRGLLVNPGTYGGISSLFDAHRAIAFHGTDDGLLAAVVGWLLSTGDSTLAEILDLYSEWRVGKGANHLDIGALRDALLGDAADLYAWVREHLSHFANDAGAANGAGGESWELPHHQLYMPDISSRMNSDATPGELTAAHQTALSLAVHGLDRRLLGIGLAAQLGGAVQDGSRLAGEIGNIVDEAMGTGSLDFPLLLEGHAGFGALAAEARGIADHADQRFVEIRQEMQDLVPDIARELAESMELHRGMLAEGLALLPRADAPVYIGYLATGEQTGHPVGTLHALTVPQFHQGTFDGQAVLGELGTPPAGMHRVVARIKGSPVRDVSFVSTDPESRRAMYPWQTDLQVTSRVVLKDENNESYELMFAEVVQPPEPMDFDEGSHR